MKMLSESQTARKPVTSQTTSLYLEALSATFDKYKWQVKLWDDWIGIF